MASAKLPTNAKALKVLGISEYDMTYTKAMRVLGITLEEFQSIEGLAKPPAPHPEGSQQGFALISHESHERPRIGIPLSPFILIPGKHLNTDDMVASASPRQQNTAPGFPSESPSIKEFMLGSKCGPLTRMDIPPKALDLLGYPYWSKPLKTLGIDESRVDKLLIYNVE